MYRIITNREIWDLLLALAIGYTLALENMMVSAERNCNINGNDRKRVSSLELCSPNNKIRRVEIPGKEEHHVKVNVMAPRDTNRFMGWETSLLGVEPEDPNMDVIDYYSSTSSSSKESSNLLAEDTGHHQYQTAPTAVEPDSAGTLTDLTPFDMNLIGRVGHLLVNMAPFFNLMEYDPECPTDEGTLLNILQYEMDHLDTPHEQDSHEKDGWHRFGHWTAHQYNNQYPWERFYDVELYDEARDHRDSMLPEGMRFKEGKQRKLTYSYVPVLARQ